MEVQEWPVPSGRRRHNALGQDVCNSVGHEPQRLSSPPQGYNRDCFQVKASSSGCCSHPKPKRGREQLEVAAELGAATEHSRCLEGGIEG